MKDSKKKEVGREEVRDMIMCAEDGYLHLDRLDGFNVHKTIDKLTEEINKRIQQAKQEAYDEALKAVDSVKGIGSEWGTDSRGDECMIPLVSSDSVKEAISSLKERKPE